MILVISIDGRNLLRGRSRNANSGSAKLIRTINIGI